MGSVGETLKRKQLVLGMANKEGGAHVDPKLTGAFADLTRNNALGILAAGYGGVSVTAPPHNAAMRQIAHEFLESIAAARPGITETVDRSRDTQN